MANHADLRIAGGQLVGHFGRVVGRAVVEDAQLETIGQFRQHFEDLADACFQTVVGIVDGQ